MSEREIQKRQAGEIAVPDYGDDSGAGFENQSAKDMVLPFLSVLQALSKPVQGGAEGAKAGRLFNTVTEEFSDEVGFVPAHTEHTYVEWVPRNKGGGFVARHAADSDEVKKALAESTKFGKYRIGDNDLIETFYVYGIVFDGESGAISPAVLAFTSTKISVYKKWMTSLRMFVVPGERKVKPPLFAHSARIKAVSQRNKEGDFYNFSIKPYEGGIRESLLGVDDPRFQAAKSIRELVFAGKAKVDEGSMEEPAEATEVF